VSRLLVQVRRSTFPVLIVLCLAALSASYAFADEPRRPLATQIIGDPNAAVTGKFAVGTATPGNKALTVVGVIDFLGSGTVHNYFTQGPGNNLQISTNVDEANAIGDTSKSQWKLVLGSSLDWFSIRRSPAGSPYNEDALFFIQGSTGNVGIATVDTNNNASIPFTLQAKLDVETASGGAVYGQSSVTSGYAFGVYGLTPSPDGDAVRGLATATDGDAWGVRGESYSTAGVGVYGRVSASSGQNYGVYGKSYSVLGTGVYGYADNTAGNGIGVVGMTASTGGRGVYAYAPSGGIAVFGDNPGGWAGYFTGDVNVGHDLQVLHDVHVYGTLYKAAGGFQIDHPLDPEHKYLSHSFVESPDMMNIYNGEVTLDENGQAWVQLPDWFEALNQDFRYQLTPIGEFAPVFVSQKIEGNRFQIAGGAAGMEVSWQVTGIRHDAYAEAHRIPVEEDKPASGPSKSVPAAVPEAVVNPGRPVPDKQ
jgi:hypothetical protein